MEPKNVVDNNEHDNYWVTYKFNYYQLEYLSITYFSHVTKEIFRRKIQNSKVEPKQICPAPYRFQ